MILAYFNYSKNSDYIIFTIMCMKCQIFNGCDSNSNLELILIQNMKSINENLSAE